MKPYYGSNTIIEQIDLSRCKPYKDFRQGFYLAEIREQVEQMLNLIFALQKCSLNVCKIKQSVEFHSFLNRYLFL